MALNIYSDILGNILDEQIDCGIDLYMQLSARRERISALPKMLNCSYKCYHRVDSAPVWKCQHERVATVQRYWNWAHCIVQVLLLVCPPSDEKATSSKLWKQSHHQTRKSEKAEESQPIDQQEEPTNSDTSESYLFHLYLW